MKFRFVFMALAQKPHRVSSPFHWTNHVQHKMLFYRLSEGRIRRVIANPKRRENGVAPNTVAFMQRNDTPKRKEEIWVMVAQENKVPNKKIIISAWRYPGVSKARSGVPLPDGLQEEILASLRDLCALG